MEIVVILMVCTSYYGMTLSLFLSVSKHNSICNNFCSSGPNPFWIILTYESLEIIKTGIYLVDGSPTCFQTENHRCHKESFLFFVCGAFFIHLFWWGSYLIWVFSLNWLSQGLHVVFMNIYNVSYGFRVKLNSMKS